MRAARWGVGIVAALLVAVLVFRWDWLIPMVEARASAEIGRPVSIGHLGVRFGRDTDILLTDVRIANPPGFPADPPFAVLPQVVTRLNGWALLAGRFEVASVALDRPVLTLLETADGIGNTDFPALMVDAAAVVTGPRIGRVTVTAGQVRAILPSVATDLTVTVATERTDAPVVIASATGTYAGQPITAAMTGGELTGLFGESRAWPLRMSIANGPTRITLRGTLRDPLDMRGADLWLVMAGPSMALLAPLTGVPIPQTPAYAVAGRLDFADGRYRFFDLAGRVGSTDINGEVVYAPRAARPAAELPLAPVRRAVAPSGQSVKADDAPVVPGEGKSDIVVSVIGGATKDPEAGAAAPSTTPAAPATEAAAAPSPAPVPNTTEANPPGAQVQIDPPRGTPRPDPTPRGIAAPQPPPAGTIAAGTTAAETVAAAVAVPPPTRRRAEVTANLTSRRVDLKDLAGFIGEEPTPGATNARPGRTLPSAPINIPRIRSANIHLTYHGERIEGRDMPLDDLRVAMELVDGVITLHPLRFGMGEGQITTEAVLTPREDGSLAAEATVGFQRLDVARLLGATGIADGAGKLGGRARIAGAGRSIAEIAGRGDGEMTFTMVGGNLSSLMVDLSGLRFGSAILSALGLPARTDIQCFIADFGLRQGVMTTRTMLLDTTDALITGTGTIDLAREALDLRLRTDGKRFSVGSLQTTMLVGGTFEAPSIQPEVLELGIRGGIAVALGFVALPLALLPTIQFGVGDDRRCAGLVAQQPAR
ncbi:AsmA family protein [Humitalea sp. 24SJ18S-53]|uniref:AsmA family protein n=1 Tax=Humitalea sp. 24SJ18S-53 TaxID=3422307 RepID=UPI003D67D406